MWRGLVVLAWATTLPSMAGGKGGEPWARAEVTEAEDGCSPWGAGVRLRVYGAEVVGESIRLRVRVEVTEAARARTPVALHFYDARGRHLNTFTVGPAPRKAGVRVAIEPAPVEMAYVRGELLGTGLRTRLVRLKRK